MKKTAKILKLLLVLLILLGIVGGIIRIYEKNRWDEKDRVVSVIMDYTEAEKIVEASDGQYNLSAFTTTGFSAIMLPSNDGEYDKLTLEQLRAGGLSIGLLPDADFNCEDFVASYLTLGANFPLIIGDDIPAGSDLSYANEAGFTLARYSGVAPTLESNSTVLVHKVSGIMDGDGTEESSQILCNEIVSSVVDEGVRVIYFSALSTSNGTINGDLSAYFSLIRYIDNELNNFGFYIDSALNTEPTPTTDFASLFICL